MPAACDPKFLFVAKICFSVVTMAKSLKGVPLKTTSEVDFVKLLKSHVRSSGGANEEEALHALSTLTKSRNTAVLVFPDRTEVGLNILQRLVGSKR